MTPDENAWAAIDRYASGIVCILLIAAMSALGVALLALFAYNRFNHA